MARINSVKFGEIEIEGKIYYSDMVVWWDGKVQYREKSHIFDVEEFLQLLNRKPNVIVVGRGVGEAPQLRINSKVKELAEYRKIDLFGERSEKAVELFNAFVSDGKKAVAVIHTTS